MAETAAPAPAAPAAAAAKAKAKEVMQMRLAELEPRDSDLGVPPDLYQNVSLFAQLRTKPTLDKYPGTTVIRHYLPGEVVCRQGEPGWTAFYILTSRDVEGLFRQLNSPDTWDWKDRADKLDAEGDAADRTAVTVFLTVPPDARRKASGVTQKIRAPRPMPRTISIDAPIDLDLQTCLGKLKEGDLFGEMSCMNRTPRSATIIAHQECYVLEMLQNIFESVLKDPAYKDKNNAITRKRAIEQMMERLPLFANLDQDQIALINKEALLKSYKSGAIICDENDRSNDMFIIHRGLVQAMKGATALVALDDATDWAAFAARLAPDPAADWLWDNLPAAARSHIGVDDSEDRRATLDFFNRLVKGPVLTRVPEFAAPAARAVAVKAAADAAKAAEAQTTTQALIDELTASASALEPVVGPYLTELRGFALSLDPASEEAQPRRDAVRQQARNLYREDPFLALDPLMDEVRATADSLADALEALVPAVRSAAGDLTPGPQPPIDALNAIDDAAGALQFESDILTAGMKALGMAADEALGSWASKDNPANDEFKKLKAAAEAITKDLNKAAPRVKFREKFVEFQAVIDKQVTPGRGVNRLVLQEALPGAFAPFAFAPPPKPPAPKPPGPVLTAASVPDWAKLRLRLGAVQGLDALREALSPAALALLKSEQKQDRQEVVYAVNDIIKGEPLHEQPAFAGVVWCDLVRRELDAAPAKADDWTERTRRRVNRAVLQSVLTGLKPFKSDAGPDTTLAYRAKGELIGEMGLFFNTPRSATCVAFIHSRSEWGQQVAGDVSDEELIDLLHIPASLFAKLKQNANFRDQVKKEAGQRRKADIDVLYSPVTDLNRPAQASEKFRELGLVQGQKLMLIDLEKCTRCDECVKACIATHDDGRSRLYLDGPRYGKYLVPTSCRACLDPVCMIPCPVGSIRRGDNNQIVIESWCIGCEACANQCPYGSIQMGDIGVIPEGAMGWLVAPLDSPEADPRAAKGWQPRQTPLTIDRDHPAAPAFACKYEFQIDPARLEAKEFSIEVLTPKGSGVTLWLNGKEVEREGKPKRKPGKKIVLGKEVAFESERHIYPLPTPAEWFLPSRNAVVARVVPPTNCRGEFFDLRCDEVRPMEQTKVADVEVKYVEKGVTHQAVVCDMCTDLPGQMPACVHACPHDAAMRVDARVNFPTR